MNTNKNIIIDFSKEEYILFRKLTKGINYDSRFKGSIYRVLIDNSNLVKLRDVISIHAVDKDQVNIVVSIMKNIVNVIKTNEHVRL